MKKISLIKNKKHVIYAEKSFVWIKMMTIRGTVHSKCKLNYKVPKDIPIIIHNVSYDAHFIINQLAE